MKTTVIDIETDSVQATKIWCIVTREVDSSEYRVWLSPFRDFLEYAATVDLWVAHNGIGFDIPVLNRLIDAQIDHSKVIDTFVVSRTVGYPHYSTHSLDEIGASLGERKKPFTDFSKLTDEMIEYCKHDVYLTLRAYKKFSKYIWDSSWSKALRVEHDIAAVCEDMQKNGFHFEEANAEEILGEIIHRMGVLEEEFQKQWPPELVEVNRLKYRIRADGHMHSACQKAAERYPKVFLEGNEMVCMDYEAFNPGSPKQRAAKLWEAGWKPTEKTKTHYEFSRDAAPDKMWRKSRLNQALYDEKKEHFEKYGWTVSEENLLTLPESAPEAAHKLAEWLTLEGRRSSLVEWLGQLRSDSRIHGKYWHIGAWTHRMSHSSPNSANIASPFPKEPTNAVERVKYDYDYKLRELWSVDEGWLVGADADGIQLRILAHYLKSDEYIHAIVSGKKEAGTDIHNVNRRALSLEHLTRDDAKTFIYAHVLGAGLAKTARILRCSTGSARVAVNNFQSQLGLDVLRNGLIARDARRGYFDGLDGRKVICNSDHLMLAGYLQNGEAVVMKHANLLWRKELDADLINYKQVNFVHDEWQTQVYGTKEEAEHVLEVQKKSIETIGKELGVLCPLAGSGTVGRNWYETH